MEYPGSVLKGGPRFCRVVGSDIDVMLRCGTCILRVTDQQGRQSWGPQECGVSDRPWIAYN